MKNFALSALAIAAVAGAASGQPLKWFQWTGQVAIPDAPAAGSNPNSASVFIDVPADAGGLNLIGDLNVDILIAHTWQGDLNLELVAPGGQTVGLLNRPGTTSQFGAPFGFSTDNFGNPTTGAVFLFDDEAAATYEQAFPTGTANPTGSFKPENALSVLDGTSKVGRWQLRVTDQGAGDVGSIRGFSLHFTNVIPAPGAIALFGAAGLAAARRRRA
jgi:subtilisin-like proprotein convertase family protein